MKTFTCSASDEANVAAKIAFCDVLKLAGRDGDEPPEAA
jgi:hypothetical protein